MKKLSLNIITSVVGFSILSVVSLLLLFNLPITTAKEKTEQTNTTNNSTTIDKNNKTTRKYRKVTSMLRLSPKNETGEVQMDFAIGRSFFVNPWVIPPASTNARDGLGPLYNARTCQQCHQGGGRGRAPEENELMKRMLVRLSIPGKNTKTGSVPEPNYGSQFQIFGIQRSVNGFSSEAGTSHQNKAIGEAKITVKYKSIKGQYPDGQPYTLRQPNFIISDLSYGQLAKDVLQSPRIGPSLAGVGLINAIKENDILALADPDDKNKDGISGRPNYVWSREKQKTMMGRFGLKANIPTLKQQVADAFVNDIGITSHIFPDENCGSNQTACLKAENGKGPHTPHEISDELFDKVVTFVSHINTPKQYRSQISNKNRQQGQNDFHASGCSSCHHPSFTTSKDAAFKTFQSKKISPYSDFLLHDMGKGLADNRPDFEASGQEWRTAPLWGLAWRQEQGKFNNYLHDGRAKTVEEAILWHSGEAEKAKQTFMHLPKDRRDTLLEFIKSL